MEITIQSYTDAAGERGEDFVIKELRFDEF